MRITALPIIGKNVQPNIEADVFLRSNRHVRLGTKRVAKSMIICQTLIYKKNCAIIVFGLTIIESLVQ